MPELPEVETIVRQLKPRAKGKRISDVKIIDAKLINLSKTKFFENVCGKIIKNIWRRSKIIIWDLSGNKFLVFHLKLNGRILLAKDTDEVHKYTRAIFDLAGRYRVYFDDSRRFGWVRYFDKEGFDAFMQKMNFGPEPLERSFTLKIFKERLAKRSGSKIKVLLMDPKFISGLGNIYSQEVCFTAGVKPERRVGTLSDQEVAKIFRAIRSILRKALSKRGTSSDAVYIDLYGKPGAYTSDLKVYYREGKKCKRCGKKIKVTKLNGRGTRHCPNCQK